MPVDLTNFHLTRGELRNGNIGFHCSGGRKHVFHHLFSDGSGTAMDIGPCDGDSCPFAQTHGLITCGSPTSCLESRRITLDYERPATYMLPGGWQGRGKNRHRSACIISGRLQPSGYYELAQEAEATDGLTSAWPPDWQTRKCESSEKGHCWWYRDDDGRDPCQAPNGSSHSHDDGDEPEHIAKATRRRCHHCPEAQLKRPDGHWSGSRDGCPCCEEFPSVHSEYRCGACGHGETLAEPTGGPAPAQN